MNYSLSPKNNNYESYYDQFRDFPEYQDIGYNISNTNNQGNKFNKTLNDIFGLGQNIFGTYNNFGSGGYGGIIGGALSGLMEGMRHGSSWDEDVPQAVFGIDDNKDSDVMQSLKGAGKGAMMGAPFGPIGMAVGAVLGLGASFLDDI